MKKMIRPVIILLFMSVFSVSYSGEKLALVMAHTTNEYTKNIIEAVTVEAASKGYDVVVYDSNKDINKQISQVEAITALGIKGIIIEPLAFTGLKFAIQKANKSGVKVVTFNSKVSNQEDCLSFVGVDSVESGRMLMQAAVDSVGGKGNMAIILGPIGQDAQINRSKGFDEILRKYPNISVVLSDSGKWDMTLAQNIVDSWLVSKTPIDIIVAQNDPMALGALKSVQKTGKNIKIFGFDGISEAVAAVKRGDLTGTIDQNPTMQGKISTSILIDGLQGKIVKPEILIEQIAITN